MHKDSDGGGTGATHCRDSRLRAKLSNTERIAKDEILGECATHGIQLIGVGEICGAVSGVKLGFSFCQTRASVEKYGKVLRFRPGRVNGSGSIA